MGNFAIVIVIFSSFDCHFNLKFSIKMVKNIKMIKNDDQMTTNTESNVDNQHEKFILMTFNINKDHLKIQMTMTLNPVIIGD